MQITVMIPEGVSPGDEFVCVHDGVQYIVQCPDGAVPGEEVSLEVDSSFFPEDAQEQLLASGRLKLAAEATPDGKHVGAASAVSAAAPDDEHDAYSLDASGESFMRMPPAELRDTDWSSPVVLLAFAWLVSYAWTWWSESHPSAVEDTSSIPGSPMEAESMPISMRHGMCFVRTTRPRRVRSCCARQQGLVYGGVESI